ncbi:MAG: PAS domain S-box protein [Gammaproteobacteria bacterium]|nr:PAS domain S-box protein [Gammaproteobacteria bacterium]
MNRSAHPLQKTGNVVAAALWSSILLAALLWLTDTLLEYLWFNEGGSAFLSIFMPLDDANELIMRTLVVSVFVLGGIAAGRILEQLAVQQQVAEEVAEDLHTTLNSIGDAVIATDTEGAITRLNPVAAKLTGWTLEEALGKPLIEVFHIINARTKEPFVNPVKRVLENGEIANLASHPLLISRDGAEFRIADSAAPIRDAENIITGAVLVFRDVTEEYAVRAALEESEKLQRDLLNNTTSVIYIKDLNGHYLFINRMFEKLFHMSNQGIKGKTDHDLFPREMADAFRANDLNVLETGSTLEFEEDISQDDGVHTCISVKFPLKKAAGEIYATCGISSDITDRKRAETELRSSSEFREKIISESPVGITIYDAASGQCVAANKSMAEFVGANVEQVSAQNFYDIESWKKSGLLETAKNALRDNVRKQHEASLTTSFGKEISVDCHFAPFLAGDKKYLLFTLSDRTEREQAKKALRHLRNYLSNIIDSMPSILVGVDSEGNVTLWNKTAEQTTGIAAGAAQGKNLSDVFPRMAPEMEKIAESIRTMEIKQERKRRRLLESDVCYEDVTIYPLITNGVEGAVIRLDDVSERVRMEEMMVQNEKMLSVGGLAAGMAHEINNPLAGMMQTADVMRNRLSDENLPGNRRAAKAAGISMEAIHAFMEDRGILGMAAVINESGRRIAKIVNNMLSFARKSDAASSSHDLAELLDKTLDLAAADYDLKKQYDFKTIEIVKEYAENLPPVPCKRAKIQQVLLNLLRNGAQAMQEAGVEKAAFILRTRYEPERAWMCIEIEDNGPGMDETVRRRVFEPFFTTKPPGAGTGLGLSVSYFIITENHGGEMSVESEPGRGARFVIRLPLKKPGDRL